jgi:hypothetical protein
VDRQRVTMPAVSGVVLLVALFAAAVGGQWELEDRDYGSFGAWWSLNQLEEIELPELTDLESVALEPRTPPDLSWLRVVAVVLALLAAASVIAWLVQRFARSRPRPHPPVTHEEGAAAADEPDEPELPVLRRGAADARRMLDEGSDPTDAIIAAWLTLERAAEGSGVTRRPSHTPTEFALLVLDRTRADPVATAGLLELYRRARFSRHPSGPADVAAAIRYLTVLSKSWEGPLVEAAP